MATEVPRPREAESTTASFLVREDGQPDLFIDIYVHPEFSAEPDPIDAEDDDGLLAEADSTGGGLP